MILYLLSLVFYWIIPLFSLLIIFLSCLILFGEVYSVREIIDFIFCKKKSHNIISKIKTQDQVKLKLIMGCHLDSNWEFPLIRKFKFGFVVIIAINVILNFFLLITLFIKISLRLLGVEKIFLNFEVSLYWLFIVFIPIAFFQLFFIISNKPVMGANDNLSGMAICYQIAKNFYSYENRLRNVELWINGYGCEEIGSKGSKFFIKEHYNEIKNAKVINLDMLGCKTSPLLIVKSEILGLAKMNKDLIELIKNSAEKLDINAKVRSIMAYTDSLSFSRKNISTISISSIPQSSKEYYYHTGEDVVENLDFRNLIDAYKICTDIIKNSDKK